jgi:hypothetical protein
MSSGVQGWDSAAPVPEKPIAACGTTMHIGV